MPGTRWTLSTASGLATEWLPEMLGVAWGFSLTTCLLLFLPYMLFCLRLADVSPAAWGRQLVRPALAALGMGAIVLAARELLSTHASLPPLVLLLVEIGIGGAAYLLLARREIRWCLDQLRRM